jgi:hypothetical protein
LFCFDPGVLPWVSCNSQISLFRFYLFCCRVWFRSVNFCRI